MVSPFQIRRRQSKHETLLLITFQKTIFNLHFITVIVIDNIVFFFMASCHFCHLSMCVCVCQRERVCVYFVDCHDDSCIICYGFFLLSTFLFYALSPKSLLLPFSTLDVVHSFTSLKHNTSHFMERRVFFCHFFYGDPLFIQKKRLLRVSVIPFDGIFSSSSSYTAPKRARLLNLIRWMVICASFNRWLHGVV